MSKSPDLKPCPFCGGEVNIMLKGYGKEKCMFITRGISRTKKNCKCRVFMEGEPYRTDEGVSLDKIRNDLAEAWNRRVNDENA